MTRRQMEAFRQRIAPMLSFLYRCRRRMQELGFSDSDKMYHAIDRRFKLLTRFISSSIGSRSMIANESVLRTRSHRVIGISEHSRRSTAKLDAESRRARSGDIRATDQAQSRPIHHRT